MRTSMPQVVNSPDLFKSAKCAVAIPVHHPLVGEALVQASLDPGTLSIGFYSIGSRRRIVSGPRRGRFTSEGRPTPFGRGGCTACRRHQRRTTSGVWPLKQLGLARLTLSAADIKREPLYSNARLVWSYRNRWIPIGLRIRVLELLAEEGPIRLANLLASTGSNEADPAAGDVWRLLAPICLKSSFPKRPWVQQTLVRCRN